MKDGNQYLIYVFILRKCFYQIKINKLHEYYCFITHYCWFVGFYIEIDKCMKNWNSNFKYITSCDIYIYIHDLFFIIQCSNTRANIYTEYWIGWSGGVVIKLFALHLSARASIPCTDVKGQGSSAWLFGLSPGTHFSSYSYIQVIEHNLHKLYDLFRNRFEINVFN